MEWISNQPVQFGAAALCNSCDEFTYNQLVDNADSSQVQFNIDSCISAIQILPDPIFTGVLGWTSDSGGWALTKGFLCASGTPLNEATCTFQFTAGNYYKIVLQVDSISVGGSFDVYLGSTYLGTITGTGVFEMFGFATTYLIGNLSIRIIKTVIDAEICFVNISAYDVLTEIIIAVYLSSGNYVTKFNYSSNPTYFNFADNTVTITVNWTGLGLSNNCYYLCLLDPCINTNGQNYPADITNCTFTGSITGWTVSGASEWTYSADRARGESVGVVASAIDADLWQDDVFNNFAATYCVTIIIDSVTNGGSLGVYFGSTLVDTLTTAGTHIVCGIPSGTFILTLEFGGGTIFDPAVIFVTSVCANGIDPAAYVCNQLSNQFILSDTSTDCTLLINACNNENGMGFNFNGSGFTPRVRLSAKLKQAKYPSERTIYEDSAGTKRNVFYKRRKQKYLSIDLQPEYIHDFLSLLVGFDNFYIDGALYFVDDDEYEVQYNGASDNVGTVKILVSEKTLNVVNINCTDVENICILGSSYLLQSDDLNFRIVQTDGFGILINN